jgi:hypothetical protein
MPLSIFISTENIDFFSDFSGGLQLLARFHWTPWFSLLLCIFGKYPILWPSHIFVAVIMLLEGMLHDLKVLVYESNLLPILV